MRRREGDDGPEATFLSIRLLYTLYLIPHTVYLPSSGVQHSYRSVAEQGAHLIKYKAHSIRYQV
eukprot:1700184-Prymnesium_polylepis.2